MKYDLSIIVSIFRNYQTDTSTIRAGWDVSGDPCPAVKYEWAVERLDGHFVQDFVEVPGKQDRENLTGVLMFYIIN